MKRRLAAGAALLVCLLALWLRLQGLGNLSLWVDEAFTWDNAHQPLRQLLGARLNVHPPAYFLLVRYWIRLGGETEYALRVPGALLSVLVVPTVWQIGRRLARDRAGLAAAAAMALAPAALSYAREARMYGLLMAEAALVLLCAERVWRRPSTGRWGLYAAVALATGLTHYAGLAAVAAGVLRSSPGCRRGAARWTLVNGSVLALLAIWGIHFWANRDAWQWLVWLPWATPVRLDQQAVDWATTIAGVSLGPIGLDGALEPARRGRLVLAGALALLAVVGAATCAARRQKVWALALLGLAVGPLIAIVLLEPVRPMWHVRFTLVGLPAMVVLAACGATAAWRRSIAGALLGLVVVAPQLYGLLTTPPDTRDDWRGLARDLRPRVGAGDVALGGLQALAGYYLGPFLPVRQRPAAIGRPPEAAVDDLNRAVGTARVVWLVPSGDPLLDPNNLIGSVLDRYAAARQEGTAGGLSFTRVALRPHDRMALQETLQPIDATYGGALHLLGYLAERAPLGDGLVVRLSLDFRVEGKLDRDYKLFSHLLDAQGATVAQRDAPLLDPARRPTTQMEAGERLRLELAIEGPADKIRTGQRVGIGIYDEASGARLALEPPAPEHRLPLPVTEGQ